MNEAPAEAPASPEPDPYAVVLRPSVAVAATWTMAGIASILLSSFVLAVAQQKIVPSALLLLCVGVTAVHAIQVLMPKAWTLRADRDGLHGHIAMAEVSRDLHEVRGLSVERVLGDPVLSLHTDAGRERLLLPVGCDLDGLRALAAAIDRDRASGVQPPASVPQPPPAP